MDTIIDFRSFDTAYITGLVFSIFEGLNIGQSFQMITSENPNEIRKQFLESQIGDFKWEALQVDGPWHTKIIKLGNESQHHSPCCGVCGG